MKYSVVSTKDWSQEKMSPFFDVLSCAFTKISAKFPDDITPEFIMKGITSGDSTLWLILDEKNQFAAFMTTDMEVSLTGVKRLCIRHLAGQAEIESLVGAVLEKIEDYARSTGADEVTICGRIGWMRALKQHDYAPSYARYGRKIHYG